MTELYDAIVIGGGVNGTGLVRDLARRGFRAVLFCLIVAVSQGAIPWQVAIQCLVAGWRQY